MRLEIYAPLILRKRHAASLPIWIPEGFGTEQPFLFAVRTKFGTLEALST